MTQKSAVFRWLYSSFYVPYNYNCVVHDGTLFNTFINLSTTRMYHLKTVPTASHTNCHAIWIRVAPNLVIHCLSSGTTFRYNVGLALFRSAPLPTLHPLLLYPINRRAAWRILWHTLRFSKQINCAWSYTWTVLWRSAGSCFSCFTFTVFVLLPNAI
jgi:hypothetical protein